MCHYLSASKILESYNKSRVNVLSLGCGFAPDYYAIAEYIHDRNIDITLQYKGLDKSQHWDGARLPFDNVQYAPFDLLKPFSFANYQIIMMNKVFSTIHKYDKNNVFLEKLENAIANTMDENAILVFHDVNHPEKGRGIFDKKVSQCFDNTKTRKYYTSGYTGSQWIKIEQSNNFKSVFFEYRK